MASGQRSGEILSEINVTPLVDVVLVLLVVLMIAATAIANRSIAVELPRSRTGDATAKQEPLVVTVDENGGLFLGAERADDTTVRARARAVAGGGAAASAVLAADARTRHASVVHALDLLRSEHIAKIAIVVRGDARQPGTP
jgi:biopolymer transport protein ExbD